MECYKHCPLGKSKPDQFKRKKAMYATWDKLEESESKEDPENEDAMLCFMAMEESIAEGNETEVNDGPSYGHFLCALEEMHEDMQKLLKKINISKMNVLHFQREIQLYVMKVSN